ncbi:MAG: serpin family protein [Candidatus Hodarchaeota archaeon]
MGSHSDIAKLAANEAKRRSKRREMDQDFASDILVARGNNEFALNLFSQVRAIHEGNIFFSPYSITSVLAMSYAGAHGETKEEMERVLQFPDQFPVLHEGIKTLNQRLISDSIEKGYDLNVANAIWVQQEYEILNEFFDTISSYYNKALFEVDFFQTERTRSIINRWVEDRTTERIKDIIPDGAIDQETRLVLTNAIYFKGEWVKPFERRDTEFAPFRLQDSSEVIVPLMYQKNGFRYAAYNSIQVLELPYETFQKSKGLAAEIQSSPVLRPRQRDLSMVIFLPKENTKLSVLEDNLSISDIYGWIRELTLQDVKVYLPRFRMTQWSSLGNILQEMGMTTAFSSSDAKFTGISTRPGVYINDVVQKAFVDVNEEGTEAAAATAVVHRCLGPPPEVHVFRADHPFIFLIRDTRTECILFMGRVMNPLEG